MSPPQYALDFHPCRWCARGIRRGTVTAIGPQTLFLCTRCTGKAIAFQEWVATLGIFLTEERPPEPEPTDERPPELQLFDLYQAMGKMKRKFIRREIDEMEVSQDPDYEHHYPTDHEHPHSL